MKMRKLFTPVYFDDEDYNNPSVLTALIISKERELVQKQLDIQVESNELAELRLKLSKLQSNPQLPNGMKLDGTRNS